jgi:hypothetical protein
VLDLLCVISFSVNRQPFTSTEYLITSLASFGKGSVNDNNPTSGIVHFRV